jgi:hypothetical protein
MADSDTVRVPTRVNSLQYTSLVLSATHNRDRGTTRGRGDTSRATHRLAGDPATHSEASARP